MELSIVTTMYRSEPYLREFHQRAAAAAAQLTSSYEIIFVNDGCPDASLARALELFHDHPHVRVIDLSRNFGHHRAIMTGLEHAVGDLVFLIDCDLEEEASWLLDFNRTMQQAQADVVYGVQKQRKGNLFERLSGNVAYSIYDFFLEHRIPRNVLTVRLMTRRYVSQLIRHRDREICLAGLWAITGFKQVPLPVNKGNREGRSYSFRQRLSALINGVTSFSNRPLIYIFYLGLAITALSAAAGLVLIQRALVHQIGVPGYASLIVSVWFLGGITIFCLGVIGIYLSKIFTETKDRPYTIVRAEYSHPMASRELATQSARHSATPTPVRP